MLLTKAMILQQHRLNFDRASHRHRAGGRRGTEFKERCFGLAIKGVTLKSIVPGGHKLDCPPVTPFNNLPIPDGIPWLFVRFWCRHGFRCLHHLIDHTLEIFQTSDGDDDRVALGAGLFRDA